MRISPKALPILMIVLDIAAAFVYASNKDWRHTVYWAAGALMVACITF